MRKLSILVALIGCSALCGCGAINSYTAGVLANGAQDYVGARSNLQKIDDMEFTTWSDSACNIKLGAVKRNATGNPNAPEAVLKACTITNPVTTLQSQASLTPTPPAVGTITAPATVSVQPLPAAQ